MYYNDESFVRARRRLFRTRFFSNTLKYKSLADLQVSSTPRFLPSTWQMSFYNPPIRIDEKSTIIVFKDGNYEYYNKLPLEKRFFYESYIDEPPVLVYGGRKYRRVFM